MSLTHLEPPSVSPHPSMCWPSPYPSTKPCRSRREGMHILHVGHSETLFGPLRLTSLTLYWIHDLFFCFPAHNFCIHGLQSVSPTIPSPLRQNNSMLILDHPTPGPTRQLLRRCFPGSTQVQPPEARSMRTPDSIMDLISCLAPDPRRLVI